MNKPFKLKYKNSAFPFKSSLRQNEEETQPSGVGATHRTVSQAKEFLKPKPHIMERGWSDKQLAKYIEHTQKIKQPGGYHAGEFQEGHKKKTKEFEKKHTKTKTKTRSLKIPLGGVVGMMLMPKTLGASIVIDPKTGKNKYTGKTEYTPF